MSVAGILSSAAFGISAQLFQNRMQKVQSEFQQLGQDLQAGNLTAAQADFTTLQQLQPQTNSSSSNQGASTLTQDLSQLSADLQAGNVSAAQKDLTQYQKDLQTQPPTAYHHHHHHHGGGGDGSSDVGQLFSMLGQALQSGNLSSAQQAYSALQQDFQQYAQATALPSLSVSG
ncbi:MAG TPA: hypothetical protein VMU45_01360 [Candidatus Eisenbacteria bacterium]|nr:hypothetical protein [Candidatus Eisenbacteria bacterium]